jgi:hypothetical protein
MADFLAAIVVTVTLTGAFVYLLVSTDIDEIMGNWEKKRCELPIMISAGMFKPKDDPRTGTQFGTDNFQFCMKTVVDSVLRVAMAPFYALTGKTVGALNNVEGPLNFFRGMLKNAVGVFGKYFDGLYQRYKMTNFAFLAIQQRVLSAMGKVTGMVYSILYLGLSAKTLTDNFIAFTTQVVKIFLIILIVMIVLLFFILIPVLPLILTVIGVLASQGIGVPGAGAFCIDPEAMIVMADGTCKPLGKVRVGDSLAGQKNRVEGVLVVTRNTEPCVSIYGVVMSGSHRVYYEEKWVLANTHPNAQPISASSSNPETLICLNTSMHTVPISTEGHGILLASDWEEVDTAKGRKIWIDLVNMTLNGGTTMVQRYPTTPPLVSPNVKVTHKTKGIVPISMITYGDEILTAEGKYTRVRGIYTGIIKTEYIKDPEWISDGVWSLITDKVWSTVSGVTADGSSLEKDEEHEYPRGCFLVTDAETFSIYWKGKECLVRDFTEVGASKIDQTYEFLESFIGSR